MSVSPLSMAAAASTSSPPLYKTNLKFPQTQTRFFFFPQKHKSLQSHTCLTLKAPPFFSLSPLHCASSVESQSRLEIENEENPIEENNNVEENDKSVKSDDEGRLYVGNLPFSMTSSQVSETFSEAGQVANVEVVYDRVTDRSRGFAFVTMGSAEEAKEAIRMFDGSQIGGRTVKVNFPEVPRGGERKVLGPKIRESYKAFVDSPHKIYAGNLGWRLTSQGLKDAFADQPGYLSARVVYERDTGRSRGYGFVTFQSADDVQAAMNAMNGVELEGRALRLNYATVRVPSSPSASRSDSESRADSAELITSTST